MIHDDPADLSYTHDCHRKIRRFELPFSYRKLLSEMEEREFKVFCQAFQKEKARRLKELETIFFKKKKKKKEPFEQNGMAQPNSTLQK